MTHAGRQMGGEVLGAPLWGVGGGGALWGVAGARSPAVAQDSIPLPHCTAETVAEDPPSLLLSAC